MTALLFGCLLAGCEQTPSSGPGESPETISSRLAEAAEAAMRTTRETRDVLPEASATLAERMAQISARVSDAGVVAAAAWPYVQARECGASEAQLRAYKQLIRAQMQKQPDFSTRTFEDDFEAGVQLMTRQMRLNGGPLLQAQRDGTCQWALDVIAGESS